MATPTRTQLLPKLTPREWRALDRDVRKGKLANVAKMQLQLENLGRRRIVMKERCMRMKEGTAQERQKKVAATEKLMRAWLEWRALSQRITLEKRMAIRRWNWFFTEL